MPPNPVLVCHPGLSTRSASTARAGCDQRKSSRLDGMARGQGEDGFSNRDLPEKAENVQSRAPSFAAVASVPKTFTLGSGTSAPGRARHLDVQSDVGELSSLNACQGSGEGRRQAVNHASSRAASSHFPGTAKRIRSREITRTSIFRWVGTANAIGWHVRSLSGMTRTIVVGTGFDISFAASDRRQS
jgi:hypothetical protein